MEKIGFVGTGAMGSALLSRLKLANVPAMAFDIAPAAMEAARAEGAQTATSAKAVAQASTMIDVVVRTDQEVLDCTMGEDGIWQAPRPARSCCCTVPSGRRRLRKSLKLRQKQGSTSSTPA